MGESEQNSKSSSNAARAAQILLLVGEAGAEGMSVTQIATALGASRASVHRALTALADHGLLLQLGRRGNYHIGTAIHALANRQQPVSVLVEELRPALMQIAAETALPTFLMARAGFDSVCVDFQSGFATVPAMFDGVGGRLPLGVGVGGQVILSEMDAPSRERMLDINGPRFEDWGLTVEDIRKEMADYAEKGWIVVSRRSGLGGQARVSSLSVSVRRNSQPELAVSVLAPGAHMPSAMRESALEAMRRYLPKEI